MVLVNNNFNKIVELACSECSKIMSKFIAYCVDQEANGVPAETISSFCEISRKSEGPVPKEARVNYDYCRIMNEKLARVTNTDGTENTDPSKSPGLCTKYLNECMKQGGPPNCYTGFCRKVLDCVNCPTALVDTYKDGDLEEQVCGGAGTCKLGWKSKDKNFGNGYCICGEKMSGLACNEYE